MLIRYIRQLMGPVRGRQANQHVGFILSFLAGVVHAVGVAAWLACETHGTGPASPAGDAAWRDQLGTLTAGVAGLLLCFVTGAVISTGLVSRARQRNLHSAYALPLLVEAVVLGMVGLADDQRAAADGFELLTLLMALCFNMGLQNAATTLMSNGEVRTTNIFALLAEIGAEMGRRISAAAEAAPGRLEVSTGADRLARLNLQAVYFLLGVAAGWLGFEYAGFAAVLPFAITLAGMTLVPAIDDLVAGKR